MNAKLLAAASFLVTAAVLPKPATAGQPLGLMPDLPGVTKSKAEAYWMAPYVRVSEERIGKRGATMVTWFNEDGMIKRQTEVSILEPGYVVIISRRFPEAVVRSRFAPDFIRRSGYSNVIRGVNEDWKIVLPNKTGPSGCETSTPDSRVFVVEFHPRQGLIALDVYVHGKLENTVGPFRQYGFESVHLSDDGSAALIVWKDESKKTVQLVVLDPGGKVSIRVDCDHPVHSPIAAPGGAGALLLPNQGGTNQNTFLWYTRDGKLSTLEVNPRLTRFNAKRNCSRAAFITLAGIGGASDFGG